MPAFTPYPLGFSPMDPISIFLTVVGIIVGTTIMQNRTTVRLAKWLHRHHRETWEKLGRPGTTFFKGDEDNRYWSRIIAMGELGRRMMQGDVKLLPRCEAVEAMLRRFRRLDRIATITFVLISAYIIWEAVTDPRPAKVLPAP
jgi:uncharacterized protein (DUF983 family)